MHELKAPRVRTRGYLLWTILSKFCNQTNGCVSVEGHLRCMPGWGTPCPALSVCSALCQLTVRVEIHHDQRVALSLQILVEGVLV